VQLPPRAASATLRRLRALASDGATLRAAARKLARPVGCDIAELVCSQPAALDLLRGRLLLPGALLHLGAAALRVSRAEASSATASDQPLRILPGCAPPRHLTRRRAHASARLAARASAWCCGRRLRRGRRSGRRSLPTPQMPRSLQAPQWPSPRYASSSPGPRCTPPPRARWACVGRGACCCTGRPGAARRCWCAPCATSAAPRCTCWARVTSWAHSRASRSATCGRPSPRQLPAWRRVCLPCSSWTKWTHSARAGHAAQSTRRESPHSCWCCWCAIALRRRATPLTPPPQTGWRCCRRRTLPIRRAPAGGRRH